MGRPYPSLFPSPLCPKEIQGYGELVGLLKIQLRNMRLSPAPGRRLRLPALAPIIG